MIQGQGPESASTGHTSAVSKGDIDNPTPDWHIASVGSSHILTLNKYSVFRPQYLLLTNSSSDRQSAPLTEADLRAAWVTLHSLQEESVMFYNCGKESGSSRAQKHMQLFPRPPASVDFTLFPDRPVQVKIPYDFYISRWVGEDCQRVENDLYTRYAKLLHRVRLRLASENCKELPHNVVLVKEWMIVIPRRKAGVGMANVGAAGMMGMVWVKNEEELWEWQRQGLLEVLAQVGVPSMDLDGPA